MAANFVDLWAKACVGTLTIRSVKIHLTKGNITPQQAQDLITKIYGMAGAPAAAPAGGPITIESAIRLIASRTAWNADMWRKFIVEGPGRALPELEGDGLNVFDEQNITTILDFQAQVRSRLQKGEIAQLVAEFEAPIDPTDPKLPDPMARGGLTNGDLKWLYKAISHNSQRNIFLGAVADATADGKAIASALDKSLAVYSQRNWHFSRWGQTWATVCPSFLGLVGLVKKIREGSLEAEDVWKYRDTEAFQATFEELEDQQYLRDLEAWDPQEFLRLKPAYDSKVPGSEDEPLFWHPDLARFMTEEVFGGAIVITKDNFLDHKRLAELVRAKQRAIRRALHVVETYVDQPQKTSLLPDMRPIALVGLVPGAVVGLVWSILAGLSMEKGISYWPTVILAIVGWWTNSQLLRRWGMLESGIVHIAALVWSVWTVWIAGSTKATYLRKGLPAAQATLRIASLIPRGWGIILLVVVTLLLLIRWGKRD